MCMAEIQTKQSYGNPWLEIWCCQTKRRGKSKDCPLFSWVTNLKIKIRRRDFEFDDTANESNASEDDSSSIAFEQATFEDQQMTIGSPNLSLLHMVLRANQCV